MAQKRMFSKKITHTDAFVNMPLSSRLLYYELNMEADDDGFVDSPLRIMRMIGCSQDDMNVLLGKNFVLPFESGVCVIKHWLIHNTIRKDRYTPTTYLDEKKQLGVKENNVYTLGNQMATNGRHSIGLGLEEVRVEENSIEDIKVVKTKSINIPYDKIKSTWNETDGLTSIRLLTDKRKKQIKKVYELDDGKTFKEIVTRAINSNFMVEQKLTNIDWMMNENNYAKILEGKYDNKE